MQKQRCGQLNRAAEEVGAEEKEGGQPRGIIGLRHKLLNGFLLPFSSYSHFSFLFFSFGHQVLTSSEAAKSVFFDKKHVCYTGTH